MTAASDVYEAQAGLQRARSQARTHTHTTTSRMHEKWTQGPRAHGQPAGAHSGLRRCSQYIFSFARLGPGPAPGQQRAAQRVEATWGMRMGQSSAPRVLPRATNGAPALPCSASRALEALRPTSPLLGCPERSRPSSRHGPVTDPPTLRRARRKTTEQAGPCLGDMRFISRMTRAVSVSPTTPSLVTPHHTRPTPGLLPSWAPLPAPLSRSGCQATTSRTPQVGLPPPSARSSTCTGTSCSRRR